METGIATFLKRYKDIIFGIFIATILLGCTPHRLPSRTALMKSLPELSEGYGRVFFFAGYFFKNSAFGVTYTMPLDDRSCRIFIEKKEITYINDDDILVIDLPEGKYDVHWEPTKYDRTKKYYYDWLNYPLEIHTGKIVFLTMHIRDAVDAATKWKWALAMASARGWTISLEEDQVAGKEALKSRKIVEYRELSDIFTDQSSATN